MAGFWLDFARQSERPVLADGHRTVDARKDSSIPSKKSSKVSENRNLRRF